jgi:hypothetical protein
MAYTENQKLVSEFVKMLPDAFIAVGEAKGIGWLAEAGYTMDKFKDSALGSTIFRLVESFIITKLTRLEVTADEGGIVIDVNVPHKVE